MDRQELKKQIQGLVRDYYKASTNEKKEFIPGDSYVK